MDEFGDIEIPFDTSELEISSPAVTPPPPKKVKKKVKKVEKVARAPEKSAPAVAPPKKASAAVLSSEGDDWSDYMDDLASSQGKTFDTGFARLDEGLGGLSPGLMLLVDEDRMRLFNFMKQITDQFASGGELRCLYIASELPKSALRLRTLSRLAGVSLQELEKGRVKKDSSDWKRIETEGRQASSWLKRVFVFEIQGELELALVQELVKKLLAAAADSSCLVVIDSLEKVARDGGVGKVVSQLKNLADQLDVLILAATTDPTLLASRDADLAAVFRESSSGGVELEVLQAGNESSTVVTFRYEPDFCRFTES
jgi:replicative DNA helicase